MIEPVQRAEPAPRPDVAEIHERYDTPPSKSGGAPIPDEGQGAAAPVETTEKMPPPPAMAADMVPAPGTAEHRGLDMPDVEERCCAGRPDEMKATTQQRLKPGPEQEQEGGGPPLAEHQRSASVTEKIGPEQSADNGAMGSSGTGKPRTYGTDRVMTNAEPEKAEESSEAMSEELSDEPPPTAEEQEQLRQQLEQRRRQAQKDLALAQRIRKSIETQQIGADLAHLIPRNRTAAQALDDLRSVAEKLEQRAAGGAVNPGKEMGQMPADPAEAPGFTDAMPSVRGEVSGSTQRSMLSPSLQKYDAGRFAKQGGINGSGGNLNIGKGKK